MVLEKVSQYYIHVLSIGPGNRGRSACGTTHVARLEFPRETGLILRGAGKAEVVQVEHAAAAKSLQSCPTLCDPIDGSPPGFPVPGILQARTLEWVAISFSNA